MSWIPWAIGWLAIAAVSLVAISVSFFAIVEGIERLTKRNDAKTRQLAASDFANDLHTNSWWFSEDESTMKLLQIIGERIQRSKACGFDPGSVRDEWRKIREKPRDADAA